MLSNKSGFTLLEIIIVIIIVAVLAGLALPRFFTTIEYSKGMEALSNLGLIRQAINRCYVLTMDFQNCDQFDNIDIENPNTVTNNRFDYTISAPSQWTFNIEAKRNTSDGGDGTSLIWLDQDGNKGGTGRYSSIQ